MSEMHERLRTAREHAGFKNSIDAARALGKAPSSYAAHENGQNKFKAPQAEVYGKKFGVKPAWLLIGDPQDAPDFLKTAEQSEIEDTGPQAPIDAGRYPKHPANASPPVPVDFPNVKIGMLGGAITGLDGKFVLNGQKIMDVLCPPNLVGVPNAYGIFVHGDSMEPRYYAGEGVFVNPHLPVRQSDFVVAQIAGDFEGDDVSGYIKRFVSMNSRELVLEQFKEREELDADIPEGEKFLLRFPRSSVIAVHKIVWSGIVA